MARRWRRTVLPGKVRHASGDAEAEQHEGDLLTAQPGPLLKRRD